jgi:restriction system protein
VLRTGNGIDSDFLKLFIYGMSRRRRKKELDLLEVVPAIAAFFALALLVPGFRAQLAGIFFLVLVAAGIALVGLIIWAIYRHYRRNQGPTYPVASFAGKSVPCPDKGVAPNSGVRPYLSCRYVEDIPEQPVKAFSSDLLNALEWRRFEQLVTWYFHKTGFDAARSRVGADGGVDIHLTRRGETKPFAYVQCKAWHAYKVGVKPVRELFGVMAADGISSGYFVTTGDFTAEALEFAQSKPLKLVTGDYLLEKLNSLPETDRVELLRDATLGDYTTPTCPRCDVKMVLRPGSDGEFWGCPNYTSRPRCFQTFKLRDNEAS